MEISLSGRSPVKNTHLFDFVHDGENGRTLFPSRLSLAKVAKRGDQRGDQRVTILCAV
jgi:hypothetical protein